MNCILPPRLLLDAHLVAYPPTFPGFKRDALAYLLHLVWNQRPAADQASRLAETPGYVPLCAVMLRKVISGYQLYVAYALGSGILETDNHHIQTTAEQAGKCRGYRFTKAHWWIPGAVNYGPCCRVVRLQDPGFLGRLADLRREQCHLSKEMRREYHHLLQWLDPASSPLRIRAAEALVFIDGELEARRRDPMLRQAKRKRGPNGELLFKDLEHQYRQRLRIIHQLVERDLNARGVNRWGRLHSTVTGIPRVLRSFVYAEGHGRLVAIDLKNSQLYFASLLFTPSFIQPFTKGRKGTRAPISLQREGHQQVAKLTKRDREFYTKLLALIQSTQNQDLEKFREWSTSDFYSRLQGALSEQPDVAALTRDDLKELVFEVVFSSNWSRSPAKTAFAQLFPTVTAVFEAYKRRDHRVLARLLQTVESSVMLRIIAKRIHQRRPMIPLLTCHDSFIVPIEFADYVEDVMRRELTSWVGPTPRFSRTEWGSDPEMEA